MPRVDDALELALPMLYVSLACTIEQTRKCARGRLSPTGQINVPSRGIQNGNLCLQEVQYVTCV